MRKWYIGQIVKLVRPDHVENSGALGVIENFGPWKYGDILPSGRRYVGHKADAYISWNRLMHLGFSTGPARFDQLEPLTPPHEACDPEFAESIRRLTDSVSA